VNPFEDDHVIGIAILVPDLEGGSLGNDYYIPIRHKVGKNLPISALKDLYPVLEDPERAMIGYNVKFDAQFTLTEGIKLRNSLVDVMLAAHLANENELGFTLKRLTAKYIGPEAVEADKQLAVLLKERKLGKGEMDQLPPEDVEPYATMDVRITWRMAQFYQGWLEEQGIAHLWPEINEYLQAIMNMENRGVLIDPDKCREFMEQAAEHRKQLYQDMVEQVGHEFNPNSVPQLRKILGQKHTDKKALAKSKHPIAKKLLQYRGWARAINTYYSKFLELADKNNRIHPSLLLHGTISGRLACRKPNLQGLPKGKSQYKVRDLIIAPEGYKIVAFDWSQAELRLLAHYTQEPFLLNAFQNGENIHTQTANELDLPRDLAKRINFSVVYGIGARGLSHDLEIPEKEAAEYLNKYHRLIPGIRKLYKSAERMAKTKGHIPMWTGRLRHYRPQDEFYKAMSNLIQGGVAEMMRVATTRLGKRLEGSRAHMVLQVHDELLFEVPEDEVMYWAKEIKRIMEDFDFRAPITVEGKVGDTWADAEDLEV